MLGHWRPLEQWRVPLHGRPLVWVLEARASKQTRRASTPQMGIQPEKEREAKGEREREREILNTGETSLSRDQPILYCSEKLLILLVVYRDQWIIQNYAASAALTHRDQAFSLCAQLYTQVLGDLHHLLARGPINILRPFSDKGLSTRRLICLNSVVLPKVWCHSQKALNKVTFLHSKDTTVYNKERGVQ